MARQKKQYRPIEGQKRWEKVLDWMTREENFRWSMLSLAIYVALLFLSVYIPSNILERPDIADVLFEVSCGVFPLVITVAFVNPLSGVWALWAEFKLQQPIKNHIEQVGRCTYDELVFRVMPIKIHLGIDSALEHLLGSRELVLEDDRYRLSTDEDRRTWRKEWLAEYGVKIPFHDLEKIFSLDLYETEGSTSIEFSMPDDLDGDYWIWKDKDEASGKEQFFFSAAPKLRQDFTSFQSLADADLFNGKNLHEVWDNAVITFLNDHGDINDWLQKHLHL